jgi:hypothetical protein
MILKDSISIYSIKWKRAKKHFIRNYNKYLKKGYKDNTPMYTCSGVAQRKRTWLITRGSKDRNLFPLFFSLELFHNMFIVVYMLCKQQHHHSPHSLSSERCFIKFNNFRVCFYLLWIEPL